ncbi:SPOR domain-containing protein [Pseudobdellovibrio exovorus]|uniref:Uncharacterized protein n=1 Tax=Pseudobdellovibrio exovorus JSS TaxID=1184267 RepID=M4V610_9BACT|nr:hypothetical protein [Pseudobdellovibrio exovorus]AGH94618.1 hypothetical protein A11Q_398 [Pseudobdellovibrio exovorus JSS]
MFTSTDSRLWLAVHLLYPHASQAFDIYQGIVQQSESLINQNKKEAIFAKLVQVMERIPPVSSNLAFQEFEFDQIDQWKVIYKNSQKKQLVIFVGVLIFEMKMLEIAPLLKLSPDKAQFLFHQVFKKLAQNSSKLKYNEQLNFKKQNDLKISYLYTYENLIEYCLGLLSEEDHEKVRAGLELYPILQVTKEEYSRIINQIQNLKVQRTGEAKARKGNGTDALANEAATRDSRLFYKKKRTWVALAAILCGVTVVGILQYTGVLPYLQNREQTLVIGALDKRSETPVPDHPEIAQGSVPEEAPPSEIPSEEANLSELPPETVAEVTPNEVPPVIAATPKPSEPVVSTPPVSTPAASTPVASVAAEESLPSEAGGLFRGHLIVDDVDTANSQLMQQLQKLGATKAGEVALGWKKSEKVAYYHYVIPEKSIAEANSSFRRLGKLVLKFEKHPRSIPAGSRRFIIEVEQK